VKYSVNPIPLLAIRGNWNSIPEKQIKILFAGLSFTLQSDKLGKGKKEKEKKEKDKKTKKKEKKHSKSLSFPTVLRSLDGEFLKSILALLGDLLGMLKPTKLEFNGKIGFPEPHYNGWLAAFIYTLEECCEVSKLQVETVWEEEHYEFSFIIEGRITIGLMLFRIARFMLARKTRKFLKMLKKEKNFGTQ